VYNIRWGLVFAAIALVISVFLGIISGVTLPYILLRSLVLTLIFFGMGYGIRVLVDSFFPELLFDDNESSAEITFDRPGSRVNITLGGGGGEYAVPEKTAGSDDMQDLGNIEDLISGAFRPKTESRAEVQQQAIDRSQEEDYNSPGADLFDDDQGGKFPSFEPSAFGPSGFEPSGFEPSGFESSGGEAETKSAPVSGPAFTPSFGDDSGDGLGGLPDLDSMATAFSGSFDVEDSSPAPGQAPPPQSFEEGDSGQYNKGNKPQPLKGDFNPKELAEGIRTVLIKDKG